MANTIKIKRGLKANIPTLNVAEIAYCTDTKELFIGTDTGNQVINPDVLTALGFTPLNKAGDSCDGNFEVKGRLTLQGGMTFQSYGQSLDFNAATLNNITSLSTRGATPKMIMGIDYNGYPQLYNHGYVVNVKNGTAGYPQNNQTFQVVDIQDSANPVLKFGVKPDGLVQASDYQKLDGTKVAYEGHTHSEIDPLYTADKPNIALKSEIPTQTSQLINNSDYTTKLYVDSLERLTPSYATMNETYSVVNSTDLATKQYVDSNAGGGTWGTIGGNLADQNDLVDIVKATDQTGTTGLPDLTNIVNIQPDWNQSDNTKYDYIKNKPTNLGIQPDWNQSNTESLDYIKNKPINITTQGNTFNGANNLVKLDANGKLPAIDGSALLNVSGSGYANIDGGTPTSVMGGITSINGGNINGE